MKRIVSIFLMFGVVALAAVALYVGQERPAAVQNAPEESDKQSQKLAFGDQFEKILNDLLKETAQNATLYKQQRKILGDLVKPVNLRNSAYVEENYKMMQSLLPELRQQMDEVLKVFDKTDGAVKAILQDKPADVQNLIMSRWSTIKMQQADAYVEFFAVEDEVLDTYNLLMEFYYKKQEHFEVDMDEEKIVFDNSEDTAQERAILNRLALLSQKQAMILQKK